MNNLQTEWDAMVLETYELRKHLENVRKQLAHTLYQHDAACRVISRLIQERDEARQALAMTHEKLKDYKDKFNLGTLQPETLQKASKDVQLEEQDNCGIYDELQEKLANLSATLFKMRKEKKKPENYYQPTDFKSFTDKTLLEDSSLSEPGLTAVDIHPTQQNIILAGGNAGTATIFDRISNKTLITIADPQSKDRIISNKFTKNGVVLTRQNGVIEYWETDILNKTAQKKTTIQGHAGVKASVHPLDPYLVCSATATSWAFYNFETGTKLCQVELRDGMELSCVTIHPDGLMVATGSTSGEINLWDLRSQTEAASLNGHKHAITNLEFSEKAIHLASTAEKENVVQLWNLKKTHKPPTSFIHEQGSTVRSVTFDPYGAYIVSAADKNLCFFQSSDPDTCILELPLHRSAINEVKFSLDSTFIVSASEDNSLKSLQQ